MDMSFALQALCAKYVAENHKSLAPAVADVPEDIDSRVARMKLKAWGIEIDALTGGQKKYLESWA